MLRATMSVMLAVVMAGCVWGQQTVRPAIEGGTEYQVYKLVRLQVKNMPEDATLLWRITPATFDRATTPDDLLEFSAPPGTYDIEATVLWAEGKKIRATVLNTRVKIGESPGPTPPGPTPPGPTPPGPTPPMDDLTKEVKQLYDADMGATKRKVAGQLASLYRWAAGELTDAEKYKTSGQLDVAMFRKSKESVENGLDNVRELMRKRAQDVLGDTPTATIDPSKRKGIIELMNKMATAVEVAAK